MIFKPAGVKPVLNGHFQHTLASLAVISLVSDNLVDVVNAVPNVRLDLSFAEGFLCEVDSSLRDLNCFSLVIADQIDEIVDVFWGVAHGELLLLSSRNHLGAFLLQLVKSGLNLLVQFKVPFLMRVLHMEANGLDLFVNLLTLIVDLLDDWLHAHI